MREYPIFVPFDEGHLGAIVTVPTGRPRALVLLLQGLGAPRAHRYGLWTRTARGLADAGIASVRLDYPEVGDSTGSMPDDLNKPPTREALTVAHTVMNAIGVEKFGVVGNCLGARAGFDIAAETNQCVSAISLANPKGILQGEGRTAPHRVARRAARKMPKFAKLVRRAINTENVQPRLRFVSRVQEAIRTTHTLFLLLLNDGGPAIEKKVAMLAANSGKSPDIRTEVQTIEVEGSSLFQVPLDSQQKVVDALVQWMDESLPRSTSASGSSAARMPAAK